MSRGRMPSAIAALLLCSLAGGAAGQTTTRASISSTGEQGNGRSGVINEFDLIGISGEGRHVAFKSVATNLVSNDTNLALDVFVRDRLAGLTTRVSVDSAGVQGISGSGLYLMGISADGRHVAFGSDSSNLVPGDTNPDSDVFVHDRDIDRNGVFDEPGAVATVRVSVSSAGAQANGHSWSPSISADGRFVAFETYSSNLAPTPANSRSRDIFVHDRDFDGNGVFDEPSGFATVRVSVNAAGVAGAGASYHPSICADGRYVAFESYATNLAPGSSNANLKIFVHDRDADGNGQFDESGGIATTQVDVGPTGVPADAWSFHPSISADGRRVVFGSDATNLAPADLNGARDVFVRDLSSGMTTRVSVDSAGIEGNGASQKPAMSGDGEWVAFTSTASNLVSGDTNSSEDIFLHELQTGLTTRVSANGPVEGNGASLYPAVDAEGRHIAYSSHASNLVPGDTNGVVDVFVFDVNPVRVTSVVPASGSEAGNDLVRIYGQNFVDAPETSVSFGGAVATLLEVRTDRITAQTPAGTGVADVIVATSRGMGTLPSGYTYVEPSLAARFGNVNVGLGDPEDVLLVNAYQGDPVRREVVLPVNSSIVIAMTRPSSRNTTTRFVLYASLGDPIPASLTQLPRGLGYMVFSPPFTGGRPAAIWNNAGHPEVLGRATLPSSPAPSVVFRRASGAAHPAVVALQGLIQDDGSRIPEGWSVTNAVILRIQ